MCSERQSHGRRLGCPQRSHCTPTPVPLTERGLGLLSRSRQGLPTPHIYFPTQTRRQMSANESSEATHPAAL